MSSGLNIFTRPWLLPHSSAAVIISAWTSAASSSHPIMRSACAVVDWRLFYRDRNCVRSAARWRTVHDDSRALCSAQCLAEEHDCLVLCAGADCSMANVRFWCRCADWRAVLSASSISPLQTPNMQAGLR